MKYVCPSFRYCPIYKAWNELNGHSDKIDVVADSEEGGLECLALSFFNENKKRQYTLSKMVSGEEDIGCLYIKFLEKSFE